MYWSQEVSHHVGITDAFTVNALGAAYFKTGCNGTYNSVSVCLFIVVSDFIEP